MKAQVKRAHNQLDIEISGSFFEKVWLWAALIFTAYAVYQWVRFPYAYERESFQGCVGAAFTGVIGFIAAYERASFRFDHKTRLIHWSRRRAFNFKSGVIPFGEVTLVSVKHAAGSTRTNPNKRVAIHTATQEIPISVMYTGGMTPPFEELAALIREYVGLKSADPLMDTVRDSVQRGRLTEAIGLLRTNRGMGLSEAKEIVDSLSRRN